MSDYEDSPSSPEEHYEPRRRGRRRLRSGRIDISWKNSGSKYPKQSSRIGFEFQALSLPVPPFQGKTPDEENYCDQIWDPKKGDNEEVLDYLANKVPHCKKEEALAAIHKNGYSLSGADELIAAIVPVDGSGWSEEKRNLYHREIFRLRKDMNALARSVDIDMKQCLAYYIGTYKKSEHYRLLKTVCIEEKNNRNASMMHDYDECAVCGDGGKLLICDGCEGEFHMSCLRPKLLQVPEGHWECDECVDRKLLLAREKVIWKTNLFEKPIPETKKRKTDDMEDGDNDSGEDGSKGGHQSGPRPMPKATAQILNIVREFAEGISAILSPEPPKEPLQPKIIGLSEKPATIQESTNPTTKPEPSKQKELPAKPELSSLPKHPARPQPPMKQDSLMQPDTPANPGLSKQAPVASLEPQNQPQSSLTQLFTNHQGPTTEQTETPMSIEPPKQLDSFIKAEQTSQSEPSGHSELPAKPGSLMQQSSPAKLELSEPRLESSMLPEYSNPKVPSPQRH